MRVILSVVVCALLGSSTAFALTGERLDSASVGSVQTITSEEIQNTSARSISDIINTIPTATDINLQREDFSQAQVNLRGLGGDNTLVLVNGRKITAKQQQELGDFLSADINAIPQNMIDRIEVLKDGSSSVYGSDAIAGVVNIITRTPLRPDDLTSFAPLSGQETQWASDGVTVGRIGIGKEGNQFNYGLSTYANDKWGWQVGAGLAQSYGLHGPVVALGKTQDGPALSVFNDYGARVGDLTKLKINYDPGVTARYLIQAEYKGLDIPYNPGDLVFKGNEFQPYSISILPRGRTMGDLYQTGDVLNYNLNNFKTYDDYMGSLEDSGCVPPYKSELVFPRTVQRKREKESEVAPVPDDPLYKKAKPKKKGVLSGLVGGVVSVGAGVVGQGQLSTADKEGPEVYDQYSLPQIGFLPKSDENSAWNMVDSDSKNVTVAVIDSGLDLAHPDGPQYIWTNDKEVPDNGKDDDNNGYIDDVNGWNFIDENNDLKDLRGHGTVVAGIIAAKTNNGMGIAGINQGAVIMPLKVADKNGNTNSLNIFRAIKYAVRHGAKVINVSLGANGVSELERLAINFARASGVLVVVASGNSGADLSGYGPSSAPSALTVGAMNFDGSRSTVSNWGPNNALMAPGEEIYSLHSKDAPWDGPSGTKERLYTKLSGTSFSAPMVAATASLLLVKDPKLTPDDLEDILLSTAKRTEEETWNGRTGAGILDAAKALISINEERFNVRITRLNVNNDPKGKKMESIDVYATVRGKVDHFTVELGKGKQARGFKPVVGLDKQQANDDLVARLTPADLRGSSEWQVLIRAKDTSGKEYTAQTLLTLK